MPDGSRSGDRRNGPYRRPADAAITLKRRYAMKITRPLPAPDAVECDDASVLFDREEITGGLFRGLVVTALEREHVWIQSCRFSGCLFPACTLHSSHFTDVTFRNCDLSNADFSGCSFQRVEFL